MDRLPAAASHTGFLAAWPLAYQCEPDITLMDLPLMRYAVNAAFANLDPLLNNVMNPTAHIARRRTPTRVLPIEGVPPLVKTTADV